eukprot:1180798-Amphidinium_carterae.2
MPLYMHSPVVLLVVYLGIVSMEIPSGFVCCYGMQPKSHDCLPLAQLGWDYFVDAWNVFDYVLVVFTCAGLSRPSSSTFCARARSSQHCRCCALFVLCALALIRRSISDSVLSVLFEVSSLFEWSWLGLVRELPDFAQDDNSYMQLVGGLRIVRYIRIVRSIRGPRIFRELYMIMQAY